MSQQGAILNAKLTYLYSRVGGQSVKLGLETTKALLQAVGVDIAALPYIHVAGTNGKGSVAAMIESALREAGVRTALYTSPHLLRFCERIRVMGAPIPDEDLLRLLVEVEQADDRLAELPGGRSGTFFELTTVVALKWFQEQQVAVTVLETGMGGRLDSTNVVAPLVSVLTHIGLEHTTYLGGTLEKVAREKTGIIKAGRPVVTGRQSPVVTRTIEARAREEQAPLVRAEDLVSVRQLSHDMESQTLQVETADGAWPSLRLPLLGNFQAENLGIAIAALEVLQQHYGLELAPEAVRAGLEKTHWPGRSQVVMRDPPFIVDVAHNPDAARALAGFIKKYRGGRPVALICGMLSDKDPVGFLRPLKPVVDACLLVPLDSERSMPLDRLLAAAQTVKLPAAESSLAEAVVNAQKWARDRQGMIVAAGSFLLVSGVLHELAVEV